MVTLSGDADNPFHGLLNVSTPFAPRSEEEVSERLSPAFFDTEPEVKKDFFADASARIKEPEQTTPLLDAHAPACAIPPRPAFDFPREEARIPDSAARLLRLTGVLSDAIRKAYDPGIEYEGSREGGAFLEMTRERTSPVPLASTCTPPSALFNEIGLSAMSSYI